MTLRQNKLNALFKKLIAQFLSTEIKDAVLTVVDCSVARDVKNATVYISVYPEQRVEAVISLIEEQQKELMEYLARHTKMKHIPRIVFKLDTGEQKRELISTLLKNM